MRKFALMLVLLIFAGVQVVLAQTTVTGTVTSSEDGKGIPGATVLVKGTTVGLTTDMSGQYKINVPASGRILQFSFVGMKTKEVTIGNQTVINVVLDPDIMDIEGVVVTALGISREKKSLGYAVQDVGAEDLTRTGNNSPAPLHSFRSGAPVHSPETTLHCMLLMVCPFHQHLHIRQVTVLPAPTFQTAPSTSTLPILRVSKYLKDRLPVLCMASALQTV